MCSWGGRHGRKERVWLWVFGIIWALVVRFGNMLNFSSLFQCLVYVFGRSCNRKKQHGLSQDGVAPLPPYVFRHDGQQKLNHGS